MNVSPHELFEIAVRAHVPDDLDLYPRIAGRLERRPILQTLTPAFLVALLILLAVSGVAYAIGRSLGYIPGVGLVEQSAPIRALAEPVSVTRDGITWSVTNAVLAADKSVVLFTLEGVAWEAFPHDENISGCGETPYLRLPDGSTLEITSGGGALHDMRFVYPPVSQEVNDLTLVMPCILGTLPGKAPENWEVPLRFVPAPELSIAEVIDISTPTPAPTSIQTPSLEEQRPVTQEPLQLQQVIDTTDGYIFLLTFTDLPQPDGSRITAFMSDALTITDAQGQPVYVSSVNDLDLSEAAPDVDMVWTYRLASKTQAWPLTFQVQSSTVNVLETNTAFTFDTGANPMPGQEWTLNQDLEIGGYSLRVVSVRFDGSGYSFMFASAPEVDNLGLEIAGATAVGGGGGSDGQGNLSASLDYQDVVPTGQLTVTITTLTTRHPGPTYSLRWQPEEPSNVPSSRYGISLIVDRYVSLDDGYYLIGHTEWTDTRLLGVTEYGTMQAYDADGQELPLEKVDFSVAQTLVQELQANQWVYWLRGASFHGPITLRLSLVNIEFAQPLRFTLDLRPYGFTFSEEQINVPWKTGLIPLDIPGIEASLFRTTYVREDQRHGFEFALEADPRLQTLALDFASGVTGEQLPRKTGVERYAGENPLLITVLTDGQLSMPLEIIAYGADVSGRWEGTWSPPAR